MTPIYANFVHFIYLTICSTLSWLAKIQVIFIITSQYFYHLKSAINVMPPIIFCHSLFYFTGQEELDCLEDCPYKTLSTNKSSALWVCINITVIRFGASLSRKKKL